MIMKYRIQFNDLTTDAYQKPCLSSFYSCSADIKVKSVSATNADGETSYMQRLIFKVRACKLLKEKLSFDNLSNVAINYNNTIFKILGSDSISKPGFILITTENIDAN